MIEILLLQALVLQAQGEVTAALAPLQQGLALAEPEGFVWLFLDEGPFLAELLSFAHKAGALDVYGRRLLTMFSRAGTAADVPPVERTTAAGVKQLLESLTPREQEVLQLIAAGHSNPEIAAELFIAVTTVKTHVKNIYGKLQVTNRFQAIARSKELNLT